MITLLSVRNLAIVESADVSFGEGLNVITGETGAGKSVLMGALHLILGERAGKNLIRTGENTTAVTAVFQLSDPTMVNAQLESLGIPPCEEGMLLIRRTITLTGSGKISVNDAPATATLLKALAPLLVNIHGPYDQQNLLDTGFQRDLLTAYANAETCLLAYHQAWRLLQQKKQALRELEGSPGERELEVERLIYTIKEIKDINPTEEDEEDLVVRHAQAANATEILTLGNDIVGKLTDGESPIFDQLASVNHILHTLSKLTPQATTWQETSESILIQLQDLSQTISQNLQSIEADPQAFDALEQRMTEIQRLKRRYGKTILDILERLHFDEIKLESLNCYEERITDLKADIETAEKILRQAGQALSQARKGAIPALSQAITNELRELGFPNSSFPILCETTAPTPQGCDAITFCFEPNLGESARPLHAIASSGEIARIMLAIKAILARHDHIPTSVFDEIDANIGGETGRKVGEKLKRLAYGRQVICITHQPQAAAYGDHHYQVAKYTSQGRTQTSITALTPQARIDELARMLGGSDLTSVTREHAKEMLIACATPRNVTTRKESHE